MRFKITLLLAILFSSLLSALSMTYSQVKAMPKSVEKDYYIWRVLQNPRTSRAQAIALAKQAKRANSKLKSAYKRKTGLRFPAVTHHKTKAEMQRKKRIVRELKRVFSSSNPFQKWLTLPPIRQVELFNSAGKNARKKLNHTLTRAQWDRLTFVPKFSKSIDYMRNEKLRYLEKGFSYPPSKYSKLDSKSSLRMAFRDLRAGKEKLAISYLKQATKYPKEREELDTAYFWLYLTTHNKNYLKKILKSHDINIYSLSARDILGQTYPSAITPNLPNVARLQNPSYLSPVYWASLKQQALKSSTTQLSTLAQQYKSKSTIGYYTWLMGRASKDVKQYFPIPYRSTLRKLPQSRQSILYAIARQESRFVPGSVSTSYALGLMQIMPFLVKHLAKERHETLDYDKMFNPVIAMKYANTHMNYLNKWIQHPLFVAYAYNAGIGYTKRMLKKGNLFRQRSKYDPYWSMEMLDNNEARRYGKHVLANYTIYMNKLGVPLRLSQLLKPLHIPSRTDKFRR